MRQENAVRQMTSTVQIQGKDSHRNYEKSKRAPLVHPRLRTLRRTILGSPETRGFQERLDRCLCFHTRRTTRAPTLRFPPPPTHLVATVTRMLLKANTVHGTRRCLLEPAERQKAIRAACVHRGGVKQRSPE